MIFVKEESYMNNTSFKYKRRKKFHFLVRVKNRSEIFLGKRKKEVSKYNNYNINYDNKHVEWKYVSGTQRK